MIREVKKLISRVITEEIIVEKFLICDKCGAEISDNLSNAWAYLTMIAPDINNDLLHIAVQKHYCGDCYGGIKKNL